MQKYIKLQPVPPSMPPEASLITKNRADSASDGTGYIYIFSPCSLSWSDRFVLRGRTWPKGVKFTVDEHLG